MTALIPWAAVAIATILSVIALAVLTDWFRDWRDIVDDEDGHDGI